MIESFVLCERKIDVMTESLADALKNKEITMDDECTTACITANFSNGRMKLLRILAGELTDSLKDYHIVMNFLDSMDKILLEELQRVAEMSDEEKLEILTQNERDLIEFLKRDDE